jgi:hypothetical protein
VTKIVATKPKATAVASRPMMMRGLGGEVIPTEYLIYPYSTVLSTPSLPIMYTN